MHRPVGTFRRASLYIEKAIRTGETAGMACIAEPPLSPPGRDVAALGDREGSPPPPSVSTSTAESFVR